MAREQRPSGTIVAGSKRFLISVSLTAEPGEHRQENSMPKCFFVVRAVVADPAKRAAFDEWYRKDHLRQAVEIFGAEKGWRFWSESDPAVHQATYQFADRVALDRGTDLNSEGMKGLIAQFDRDWPGVARSREIFTLVDEC
jgi:hypothetical protein